MISESEAREWIERALDLCEETQAEALLYQINKKLTRFANNAIHQNVSEHNMLLQVRVVEDGRVGAAVTNKLDDGGLVHAVEGAMARARLGPKDPELPDLADPSAYAALEAYDPATAEQPPQTRAAAVAELCAQAKSVGLTAFGAYAVTTEAGAVGNTHGVFGYRRGTAADFQVVIRQNGSSGWAQASSWRASDLDTDGLGQEAIRKASKGKDPRPIDPGEYTVVLDPYATRDLVSMLNLHGMGGVAFLDGRSWMNGRVGERAMSSAISIWDDPLRIDFPPLPFDEEGTPKARLDIVAEGVVRTPAYDRRVASRAGTESTGHALPAFVAPWARAYGPLPRHLVMGAGEVSTADMIRSTKKGLYITRFWYTRLVHPRDCVITGMTRDGVFLIEGGKLSHPVKDLRFTQSYVDALAQVEAVGSETRTLLESENLLATRVPALKLSRFRFTGSTV